MRHGITLVEVLVTTALLGAVTAVAVPRFSELRDRLAVHAAATDVVSALSTARATAFARWRLTSVTFDAAAASLTLFTGADTLARRPLRELYGVAVAVTRDSVTYAPNAMGYGASNARIVLTRGAAADTVTVSRLGRVRR